VIRRGVFLIPFYPVLAASSMQLSAQEAAASMTVYLLLQNIYIHIHICIQLNKLERVYYYVMWMEIRSLVMSEKIEYCQIGISSDRLSRVGSLSYRNIVSYLSEEHTLRNIDKMIKDAKAKMAKGDKKGKTALLFVIRNIYLSLLTLNHFCCRCPLCYEA